MASLAEAAGDLENRNTNRITIQPNDIVQSNVDLSYQSKTLLTKANVKFISGRCYALLGRNGCGKSSLLRAIDNRTIPLPPFLTTYLVTQEIPTSEASVKDFILSQNTSKIESLETKLDALPTDDADAIEELCNEISELELASEDSAPLLHALAQFGVDHLSLDALMNTLSGGERKRVALATAALVTPDVLLLDEVTNHLDAAGINQLSQFLSEYPHTVILVTHNRDLTDYVCNHVAHMVDEQLHYTRGNYNDFLGAKAQNDLHQTRIATNLNKERDKLQSSIDTMKGMQRGEKGLGGAKRGKQIESKKKKLDRHGVEKDENGHRWSAQTADGARAGSINATVRAQERKNMSRTNILRAIDGILYPFIDKEIQFVLRKAPEYEFHEPLVKCEDVEAGFSGEAGSLFYCDMTILQHTRTIILGPNGSGKTQLLKILAQEIQPKEGRCVHCANVNVASFSQMVADDILETVEEDDTPLSFLARKFPLASEQELRGELASFGIQANMIGVKVKSMSGGERVRVIYASLMLGNPQLLILDEPNNHLDLESVEAIAVGLGSWDGTLIISSHDSSLLRRLIETSGADKPCVYYSLTELDDKLGLPYKRIVRRLDDREFEKFFNDK